MTLNKDGYIHLLPGEDQALPSILIAGDLCPNGQTEELLATNQVEVIFPGIVEILHKVDVAIVNLECPLTNQSTPIVKSGPHLRADPSCAKGIRKAGFDAISLANNHILDMGGSGLMDTLAACAGVGLKTVGANENLLKAGRPLQIDAKGLNVSILAFAENEFSIATQDTPGACPVDPVNIFYQIKQAKKEADFILVLLHGGNEYYELPSPNLVKLCRYIVDLGANALICNHVHVPGGLEIYKGVPIIYSCGNFLFEGKSGFDGWHKGFLVKLNIQKDAVVSMQLIPYWQSKNHIGVRLMNGPEQDQFFDQISQLSNLIIDPAALVERWKSFVHAKRSQYLYAVLGLNKVERLLLRLGVWPSWRLKRSSGARLLNLFSCEAHREVMISLLSTEFLTMGFQMDPLERE